nr:hypothetical protein [Bovine gammaherpesvirus 4]
MGILNAKVLRIRYLQSLLAIFCSSLARARPPENVLYPGWLFCAYIGRPQFGGVLPNKRQRGVATTGDHSKDMTLTQPGISPKSPAPA